MKIIGYRKLTTFHDWGRPIGDVNGVMKTGVTAVPIVLVNTDSGLTGVGIGSHDGVERAFPALEGEDPRAVSSLYDRMLARVFKAGHGGSGFGGIGTLDTALWDLKAKAAGQPLWQLLGASDRFVPGYASALEVALSDEELHNLYQAIAARGFTAGKIKGGRDSATDIQRLQIVADSLRTNTTAPDLMLDANESWNVTQARRYVAVIEEHHDLAWVEEPVRRWDAAGHAKISASIRAAVATGENLTGLEQYGPLFDQHGVDIVQAAAVWGVTHFLRVALAAHSRNLPMSPIGLSLNPAVAHAAAAIPNHLTAEVQDFGAPFGLEIDQEVMDGGIILGRQDGIGVTIDEQAIQANQKSADWIVSEGPHVRPSRSGLSLSR